MSAELWAAWVVGVLHAAALVGVLVRVTTKGIADGR